MKLYQAYLNAFKDLNDDAWYDFVIEFPLRTLEDKNLKKLLLRFPALKERWKDIESEYLEDSENDLYCLRYYYYSNYKWVQNIPLGEVDLINASINICKYSIRGTLIKHFVGEKVDPSHHLYSGPLTVDEWHDFQNLIEPEVDEFDASNYFDYTVTKELDQLRTVLESFSFESRSLKKYLLNWVYLWKPRMIMRKTPIITQFEYFDPTVYELLLRNPELLTTLDWRIFEELLADILKTFGYEIELTKKTKDGGIDVIAIQRGGDFGLHKYILQAKRYNNAVQVSPVRELLYLHQEQKATKSCLATTSTFTKGAWDLGAQHRWTLELKDKSGLLEWIEKARDFKSKMGLK